MSSSTMPDAPPKLHVSTICRPKRSAAQSSKSSAERSRKRAFISANSSALQAGAPAVSAVDRPIIVPTSQNKTDTAIVDSLSLCPCGDALISVPRPRQMGDSANLKLLDLFCQVLYNHAGTVI